MTTEVRAQWGARLRQLRKEHGFTLRQITELTGISKGYYCHLENGVYDPSTDVRLALARAYGVQVHEVFTYPDTVRS